MFDCHNQGDCNSEECSQGALPEKCELVILCEHCRGNL